MSIKNNFLPLKLNIKSKVELFLFFDQENYIQKEGTSLL